MSSKDYSTMELLLYSFFGITLKSSSDEIINSIIEKSYIDATNQGAYNNKFSKEIGETKLNQLKEASAEAKKEAKKKIIAAIGSLNTKTDYDEWHKIICKALECDYCKVEHKDVRFFKYGNAQKWVNMTVKYIYILNDIFKLLPNSETAKKFCEVYDPVIEKLSPSFHTPVDDFIIEALWTQEEIHIPLPKNKSRKNNKGFFYKYSPYSEHAMRWSQWELNDYEEFRKSIDDFKEQNGGLFYGYEKEIDWEGPKWIDISVGRKK